MPEPFPEHVQAALDRWADFPVHREPRPIVLTGLPLWRLEELKDDDALRAEFAGAADPATDVPEELLPAALEYSHDVRTGAPGSLFRMLHRVGPFGTDRGIRDLPAWMMFPMTDRRWPFIGLDPEFRREMTWFPQGMSAYGDEESILEQDGVTLRYRFTGTPKIYADYPDARLYETEQAVYVEPVEVPLDGENDMRLAYADRREVVVRLSAPLGNRVLIWKAHGPGTDTFGAPRVVVPEQPAGSIRFYQGW